MIIYGKLIGDLKIFKQGAKIESVFYYLYIFSQFVM